MEAGRLRHRVTIQRPTETASVYGKGAAAPTWLTVSADVPAEVRPLRAQEIIRAGQAEMETTHVVRMRYTADVIPERRLAWVDATGATVHLEIESVVNVENRNRELEILCHQREVPNA